MGITDHSIAGADLSDLLLYQSSRHVCGALLCLLCALMCLCGHCYLVGIGHVAKAANDRFWQPIPVVNMD